MSAIFFHNDEQKRLALETKGRVERLKNEKVHTEILPLRQFYIAEDYHQKYRLQQEYDLMKEYRAIYPLMKAFVNSTSAARVNGYLDGYGKLDELKKDISGLGLSAKASKRLMDSVSSSVRPPARCPL